MRLTTKGRFAVTAMMDLAMRNSNGPITLADISERQQISLSYLEQLFGRLRRHGLVSSVRGPGGGYRLAKALPQITRRGHHPGGGRADRRHPVSRPAELQGRPEVPHPRPVGKPEQRHLRLPALGQSRRPRPRRRQRSDRLPPAPRTGWKPRSSTRHPACRRDPKPTVSRGLPRLQRNHADRRAGVRGDAAVSAAALRQRSKPSRLWHRRTARGGPGPRAGRAGGVGATLPGHLHQRRH